MFQTNSIDWKACGRLGRTLFLGSAVAMMTPCLAPAQGADVAAAEAEGQVSVYVLWLTDTVSSVTGAFKKKYPNIEVEFYRNGGPLVAERFRSEFNASGHSADIISLDPAELERFASADMIVPYKSPEADHFPDWARSDKDLWTGFFSYTNGHIVNTNVFPDKETWPKDWADFAHPRAEWKGKVCTGDIRVASHTFNNLAAINQHYGAEGDEGVWAQYGGLVDSDVRIYTGAPQARELVASGECPLIHQIPFHNFVSVAEAGAPVAWIVPKEGMIPVPQAVAIAANAQHPNAAKLFYDFLLSEDGQAAIGRNHLAPLRDDASDEWWPDGIGLPPVKDAKIMPFDQVAADAARTELLEHGSQVLGLN